MYYGYSEEEFISWYRRAKLLILSLLFNLTPINIYKKALNTKGERPDGVMVLRFRLPFTFSRSIRSLYCVFPAGSAIKSIKSWGYEDSNCEVSGACAKEFTTITFQNGRKEKIVKTGRFHYTYKFVIEDEFGHTCDN